MKEKYFLILSLLYLFICDKIEIPLYKSPSAYEELKKSNAMIDDIDRTHLLADLKIGTPSNSFPLQVEMATDEIFIVNDKFKPKRVPLLSPENSKTFKQSEGIKGAFEKPATDKIEIGEKNFNLQFQSS